MSEILGLLFWQLRTNWFVALAAFIGGTFTFLMMRWIYKTKIENLEYYNSTLLQRLIGLKESESESEAVKEAKRLLENIEDLGGLEDHNSTLDQRLIELEESESGAVKEAKRLKQELKRTDNDIRKDNRQLQARLQARNTKEQEKIDKLERAKIRCDGQIRDLHEANSRLQTANISLKARILERTNDDIRKDKRQLQARNTKINELERAKIRRDGQVRDLLDARSSLKTANFRLDAANFRLQATIRSLQARIAELMSSRR